MSTTNTYAALLPRKQQQSFALLDDLFPRLKFVKFSRGDVLDQRTGKKGIFRLYDDLASPVAASGEGDTAVGQQMTCSDVPVNIVHFLSSVPLTKDMVLYHEDDFIAIAKEKIPRQLAQTADKYLFSQYKGGTQVRYAKGVASRVLTAAAPTRADFDLAVRDLEAVNVPRLTKIVAPSIKINTTAIPASYIAICHPNLRGDIVRTDGYVPIEKYGSLQPLDPDEGGSSPSGLRFIFTTICEPWLSSGVSGTGFLAGGGPVTVAASADVYPILIIGEDAWGHLDLKNHKSMEVSVIKPGSPQARTVTDPTGENGCVAADLIIGGCILDERRTIRLECLASKTWN